SSTRKMAVSLRPSSRSGLSVLLSRYGKRFWAPDAGGAAAGAAPPPVGTTAATVTASAVAARPGDPPAGPGPFASGVLPDFCVATGVPFRFGASSRPFSQYQAAPAQHTMLTPYKNRRLKHIESIALQGAASHEPFRPLPY